MFGAKMKIVFRVWRMLVLEATDAMLMLIILRIYAIRYPAVDVTIMGELSDNIELVLELTLRNIFDEERRDSVTAFMLEEVHSRYGNEDNPFIVK